MDSAQAKLDVSRDRILLSSTFGGYYIFQLVDIPLLEANAFGAKLLTHDPRILAQDPRAKQWVRDNPNQYDAFEAAYCSFIDPYHVISPALLFPPHRNPDVELSGHLRDDHLHLIYYQNARFDVLIAGKQSVRLYHSYKDALFVSFEPDYLLGWYLDSNANVVKNLPKPPERQLRTGKLPADFKDEFRAYASGDCSYLVSESGKVYMITAKGKTELEVSKLWTDPKQKIVGVVKDSATDTVYGWGFITDRDNPNRFYVKFEPKAVSVPYQLTVPLWDDRSDAYLESYECARAFRKAQKDK